MDNQNPQYLQQHLLVFILSLGAPFVLYIGRHLDDNRLTSWKWAFNSDNLPRFFIVSVVLLLLAWLLSRFSFYEKGKPAVLFFTSFFMAASFWPEPEVIVDAARYFSQAKHLKVYGLSYFFEQWGKSIFTWTDLPLLPFIYGMIFKFAGEHRVLIQILNTTFYSLTVVLTYQLGRILWDEETGFWGGVLLLGFPYLYTQVPLMLVDVPTMFFFMLAVVTCVYALKKGGVNNIAAASFSLFLVFYVKYSSWVLLTVIPVVYVYFLFKNPVQTMRRGGWVAILSLALVGVLFVMYHDVFIDQVTFLVEYQKPGLNRWSESYVSTFLFQIHPFISAAALLSFFVAARKMDFRFIIICFLLVLFLFIQVKRIRYTLPIFPMVALMAAYGIGVIKNKAIKKHIVLSVVATSFAVAFIGFLPLLKSLGVQNLQEAGRYINTLSAERFEVVSFAGKDAVVNPDLGVPVLDIYIEKKLFYEKKPTNPQVLERTQASPLRFTWEFPTPEYYLMENEPKVVDGLVVIADNQNHPIPESIENKIFQYPVRKKFQMSSNIFQHQTFITVYHK